MLGFATWVFVQIMNALELRFDTPDPYVVGVGVLIGAVLTGIAIDDPEGAKKGWSAFGGCLLLFFVLLPLRLIGFPGFSHAQPSAWWIRFLDVLANLVWLLAAALAYGIWHNATQFEWTGWDGAWKAWMIVVVPSAVMMAIRWAVIFIVRGADRAPQPIADEEPETDKIKIQRPRGPAQFLPATARVANNGNGA